METQFFLLFSFILDKHFSFEFFFLLLFIYFNSIRRTENVKGCSPRHVPVFLSLIFRVFANHKQEKHQRNELVLCCQHKEGHINRMGWKQMRCRREEKKSKQCERKNKMYNCILKVDHIVYATKCVVCYLRVRFFVSKEDKKNSNGKLSMFAKRLQYSTIKKNACKKKMKKESPTMACFSYEFLFFINKWQIYLMIQRFTIR